MSQRNDLAEKVKITWDGEEIPGLVSVSEGNYEQGTIEVPEFRRKRKIKDGITTFSERTLTYKVQRGNKTMKFLKDFFLRDETHDATHIHTDATGVEFDRELWQGCECTFLSRPEVDLAQPKYAQIIIRVVPFEVIPLDAEA